MKLEAKNLKFRYGQGEKMILEGFSMEADSSERVGLVAPRGVGNTTLWKILAGYLQPEEGEVLLDGKTLSSYKGYCPVQMIWQQPGLSVNPARGVKMVLAEGDWREDGGVMRGRI